MMQNSINDNQPSNPGPVINLPPATWRLLMVLSAIHIILWCLDSFSYSAPSLWAWANLGFIPARFSGSAPFTFFAFLSPVTYSFLHGSWFHLGANLLMLMAFGSGCEKMLGARIMLFTFILTSIFAVLLQFLLDPASSDPIIGASGGLSGLFGLMIVFMRRNPNAGLHGLMPLISLWILISVITGLIGSPDGSDVAWAAHIGGFLAGIGFGLYLTKPKAS